MRIRAIVAALLTVCATASMFRDSLAAQGKSQWDGVYTETQSKRGNAVYAEQCATCHGPDLEGKGEAPGLAGPEFATAWNELTLNDLFERIRVSMPKDKGNSLTREQYADVVTFILSKNGAPAGKTELPNTADGLKAIMFKGTK